MEPVGKEVLRLLLEGGGMKKMLKVVGRDSKRYIMQNQCPKNRCKNLQVSS